ncbi:glycoside hydrolase family 3 protein [Rhodanobacter ginsenosidimutans]|uniref:Exo 1,3/1,4-beta-D-glucan glucohydrolase n=1 Tax=Rhodanobacter ginsenosidimutans TaxID=490571 RepID=A0ABW0JTR2_9GAMM
MQLVFRDRRVSIKRAFTTAGALVCAFTVASACSADVKPTPTDGVHSAVVHPDAWPKVKWPFAHDAALEQRVKSLLAKMSDEDKVGQIIQADIASVTPDEVRKYRLGSILAGGNSKPGGKLSGGQAWLELSDAFYHASVDTSDGGLGIPVLFGVDAVHGHNDVVGATIFPQNSALGAMRDPALVAEIAAATAEEARATGINWTFAPTLTVPQDDRWGRAFEGYSEDPAVVASYAAAVVEGLQGKPGSADFLDNAHVIASAKHFVGDGSTKDGKDQGDAEVSEENLRDVASAGYPPAIAAGVQTVMASFSSWNGEKMSGHKGLLTDVLKGRMDFQGFVVGDWNGHGQVPGCTNEDCPQAINAGMDMFMAPDSWRGLYKNTLAEVKSGVIPMSRLDDAVSRILRVKMRLGLFDKGSPSSQVSDNPSYALGSPEHRAIARRAVRETLVLLKNHNGILPLNPKQRILVAGDGADNIPKQSGGWTLTWQGTGTTNADFPNGQSIWGGIHEQVVAAGGTAQLSVDGKYTQKPDVAIVVYGENPYAEFQGDIPNLLFSPGDSSNLDMIKRLRAQGIPVVSVFLSGRPLWVNPEINASNAFVAAWLPGSEGGGVADVILRTAAGAINHDFHGKLAYSWPRTAVQTPLNVGQKNYNPQFAFGYGLTYKDKDTLGTLSEVSGVKNSAVAPGLYLQRGKPVTGLTLQLTGADGATLDEVVAPARSRDGSIRLTAIDYQAQEDARRVEWSGAGAASVALHAASKLDQDRQTNGDVLLVTTMKVDALAPGKVSLAVACGAKCGASVPLDATLATLPKGEWLRVGVPLKCFREAGADMTKIDVPFRLQSAAKATLSIARVALGTDVDKLVACPTH